jgi:hypothetical protein
LSLIRDSRISSVKFEFFLVLALRQQVAAGAAAARVRWQCGLLLARHKAPALPPTRGWYNGRNSAPPAAGWLRVQRVSVLLP